MKRKRRGRGGGGGGGRERERERKREMVNIILQSEEVFSELDEHIWN